MCDSCGCNVTPGNAHLAHEHSHAHGTSAVEVLSGLMDANDRTAAHNRAHFEAHGLRVINLMSSPGSGKTALLEATIRARPDLRIAVIEGDLETENDAARIRAQGAEAVQITTGSACHLDAHMVHEALHRIDLSQVDLLFIENVGNLVCPAGFDLGQHANVVLLSVTEGDDKPAKYPVMFRAADLLLLTKSDLAEHFPDFENTRAEGYLRALANPAPVLPVAARTGALSAWLDWIDGMTAAAKAAE